MGYFGHLSLKTLDALPKRRSIPSTSIVDENLAPPAAATGACDLKVYDGDWDLDRFVSLDAVKRVGAKRHLRDF